MAFPFLVGIVIELLNPIDSAHCSFPLPTADATTPPRESIEIRAVVLSFPRDEQSFESSAPKDVKV